MLRPVGVAHQGRVQCGRKLTITSESWGDSSLWQAIMITYPSTFGVFEDGLRELCDLIHEHGGG
jgi:glycine cleavage system protein P-like pyridoxal-binding family